MVGGVLRVIVSGGGGAGAGTDERVGSPPHGSPKASLPGHVICGSRKVTSTHSGCPGENNSERLQ